MQQQHTERHTATLAHEPAPAVEKHTPSSEDNASSFTDHQVWKMGDQAGEKWSEVKRIFVGSYVCNMRSPRYPRFEETEVMHGRGRTETCFGGVLKSRFFGSCDHVFPIC